MTWAPSYATAAQLRTYMRMDAVTADATDIAQDTLVHTPAVEAASRAIDAATGRQFGSVASEARYYTARYHPERQRYVIPIDDAMAAVTLAADLDYSGTYATAVTAFALLPRNASVKGRPATDIELLSAAAKTTGGERYKATSAWGWTSVPSTILEATLLQASRIAKRRDAPFGVAGSPEMGNEIRLLAKLDPDVEKMVSAYRRYW